MFAQHLIGVILPLTDETDTKHSAIPDFVDRVYVIRKGVRNPVLPASISIDASIIPLERAFSIALRRAVSDGMGVICILGGTKGLPSSAFEGVLNLVVWNKAGYIHLDPEDPSSTAQTSDLHQFTVLEGVSAPHFTAAELNRGLTVLNARGAAQLAEGLLAESKRLLVALHGTEEAGLGSVLFIAKKYTDDILIVFDENAEMSGATAPVAGMAFLPVIGDSFIATAISYAKKQGYDFLVVISGGGAPFLSRIPALLDPLLRGEADAVYCPGLDSPAPVALNMKVIDVPDGNIRTFQDLIKALRSRRVRVQKIS
ncbi:MAG: hypothetical protein LUO93_03695 [Methanomicrobiales archaeon]|nr:hypothetical protein [Methanomicrobiales archaeon]